MPVRHRASALINIIVAMLLTACAKTLTPEQKEQLAALKQEQTTLAAEVDATKADDAKYGGGLIKSLIGVRLELLKTNQALIQQRIHALEGHAAMNVAVSTTSSDPARAAALAKDIAEQRRKLAEAKAESARYEGGLVKALAEVSVATVGNTLALLEQEQLKAAYGMAMPTVAAPEASAAPSKAIANESSTATPRTNTATNCLKFGGYDSSVLQTNNVFTEVAWKADVVNSCDESFTVSVVFTLSDKDDFELDSDNQSIRVDGHSTGNARGKMLVSPPEKARRMAKQGVSLTR